MDSEHEGLSELLDRAIEFSELKEVERTGWVLRGVERSESVADHSWGTAQLCLLFVSHAAFDPSLDTLDPNRAISMALVHDLAEVRVGDIPRRTAGRDELSAAGAARTDASDPAAASATSAASHRDPSDARLSKTELEEQAMMLLTGSEGASEAAAGSLLFVRDLWREYEAADSAAARFVRDMNLIDMCLQAYVYERDNRYDPVATQSNFPDYARMDEFFETSRTRFSSAIGRHLLNLLEERYRAVVHSSLDGLDR